ncbi:LysR family transcriptional regulator [Pseudohalocynthiibacter aestuariivivens]|nr:LysR family transcriptional regulator [Pseudohalocynthiibacter aestuariivivens]QIE45991.1 LysR family transcriptional regulator [Pseudohalocynthiibacter aestuariivivens]
MTKRGPDMSKSRKALLGPVTDTDIRLLRIFAKIIECGSLSAAEAELGIGRSTLSRHLSDLETRLGLTLCFRKRGHGMIELTREGEIAIQHVDRLLTSISQFTDDLMSITDDLSGEFWIGVMDYTHKDPSNPLESALRGLQEKFPNVMMHVITGSAHDIELKILRREVDAGIVQPFFPIRELRYAPLYTELVGLFAGQGHPLYGAALDSKPISAETIYRFALVRRGYRESEIQERYKDMFPLGPTVGETEAAEILVRSGCYLGFLPVHSQLEDDVAEIRPDLFRYEYPVAVAYARDRAGLPIVHQLLKELGINKDPRDIGKRDQ